MHEKRDSRAYTGSVAGEQVTYRPCAKHLLSFMSKGVVVSKNDIFQKIPACRPQVLQRCRVGQLAGWLQPRQAVVKACAINSVTINSTGSVQGRWLAGCMQGRYSDLASVSLSDRAWVTPVRIPCMT